MNIKYLVEFKYGKPAIYEVEVLKETEKTITVRQIKTIIGWMYLHDGRMSKDNFGIFDTKDDAINSAQAKANLQISVLQNEISMMEKTIRALERTR